MKTVLLDRGAARDDLRDTAVRLIDSPGFYSLEGWDRAADAPLWGMPVDLPRPFLVTRPALDVLSLCKSAVANDWRGMRTKGTNPTLWGTDDPQTLALLVERNHDYPDPDWFGQSICGD